MTMTTLFLTGGLTMLVLGLVFLHGARRGSTPPWPPAALLGTAGVLVALSAASYALSGGAA